MVIFTFSLPVKMLDDAESNTREVKLTNHGIANYEMFSASCGHKKRLKTYPR